MVDMMSSLSLQESPALCWLRQGRSLSQSTCWSTFLRHTSLFLSAAEPSLRNLRGDHSEVGTGHAQMLSAAAGRLCLGVSDPECLGEAQALAMVRKQWPIPFLFAGSFG